MTKKIDSIDQSIIRLLFDDARMPTPEIARYIPGTSERTIRYRISRLLNEGVIQLRTIVVPGSLGFSVTAEVFVRVEIGRIKETAIKLAEFEEVSHASCTLGNHDVTLVVHARDNNELYTIVSEKIVSIPGVKETTVAPVPLLLKDNYHWQIPDSVLSDDIPPLQPPLSPHPGPIQTIDWADREIVHLLIKDARMSAAAMERHVENVSQRSISDRIDSLIQRDVIRVRAVVNPEAVGYPIRVDMHIKIEPKHVLNVARQLANLKETSWVACSIGNSDLTVQIYARDIQELYRFIIDVIYKVPGIISAVTTLNSEVIKDTCDWHIPESVITHD